MNTKQPSTTYSDHDIQEAISSARSVYQSGLTRPLQYRMQQLRSFYEMLENEEVDILDALEKDLRKPKAEGFITEIATVKNSIAYMIANLEEFMEAKSVHRALPFIMDRCETRRVALGVVLIISPWNYPVQLSLNPLVGAIAGGNAAILKPSDVSPHTAELLARLIPKYLDSKAIKVITGGIPETTTLLKQRFDLIFFTGSIQVGKIVMKAAALNLTPTVLELGGKSPVIVDDTVDPMIAAKRIAWGKLVNCGQTCIAPDYILVNKGIAKLFKIALREAITFVLDEANAQKSPHYGRIISINHFNRLKNLLERQEQVASSVLESGGCSDEADFYIEPTIFSLSRDEKNNPLMEGELFGPIFPVIEVDSVDDAISYVKDNVPGDPLSLYVFTKKTAVWEKVFASINCGHAVVNETLMNAGVEDLPFGGVNESGLGSYHGIHSFRAFTREQGFFIRGIANDWVNHVKYPSALGEFGSKKFKFLMSALVDTPPSNMKLLVNSFYRFIGGGQSLFMLVAFGIGMAASAVIIRSRS